MVGIVMAQPSIQSRFPDVEATGIKLVPATDSGRTALLNAILARDADLIAPVLPYSVLLVNGSSHKLRAIGILYQWKDADGHPRGSVRVLGAMQPQDPAQLSPGDVRFFSPLQEVNQYLAASTTDRQDGKFIDEAGVTSVSDTLPLLIHEEATNLAAVSGSFTASIEGIVFEDFRYLGSDNLLRFLQRTRPQIHR